jgi:Tol biopolymer transport system component
VQVRSGEYSSIPPGRAPSVPRPIVARSLFVSEREGNADVWLLDEEGREFQLTHNQADDLAPAWSPDGTRIVFETLRDGNSEIYVMNSDGSEQVNLTRNSAPDHAPAWSPDGTRIAFESLREGGRDIYIMNADGSSIGFETRCYRLTRWSADGQVMVFSTIDRDTNLDGLTDLRDMGAFFFLDDEGGTAQRVWGNRMIFEQTIFPWGRGMVG